MLDTNIIIARFADDPLVTGQLAVASEGFLASIVLGELYYGTLRSSRVDPNTARITAFANTSTVLPSSIAYGGL